MTNFQDLPPSEKNLDEKKLEKKLIDSDNTIFVGKKELVKYVRSVVTQYKKTNQDVIIKSRGKFISKAVDIAEISRRNLDNKIFIKNVKIDSENFEQDGKKTTVSTMDITLGK